VGELLTRYRVLADASPGVALLIEDRRHRWRAGRARFQAVARYAPIEGCRASRAPINDSNRCAVMFPCRANGDRKGRGEDVLLGRSVHNPAITTAADVRSVCCLRH
jgi:hypothetical protein